MLTALVVLLLLAGMLAELRAPQWETLPGGLRAGAVALAGIAGGGLSALVLYGLARLFGRWFPVSRAYELTYTQSDWEDFRRRTVNSTLVFLFLAAALSVLLRQLLLILAHASDSLTLALYVIPTQPGFWNLPALAGGCSLAALLTYAFYRWRLKERFPRFLAFHNQRLGFDQRKAGLALVVFEFLLSLGLAWIGLNMRARLDYGGVAVERFFGVIEERHAYGDITLIEEQTASQGSSTSFAIHFRDGSRWRSGAYTAASARENARQALAYAAQRSGVPLTRPE